MNAQSPSHRPTRTHSGDGGIGLKSKHIEALIEKGVVIKLHGVVIDWSALLQQLKEQNLSVAERERRRESKLVDEMRSYWGKAVMYVEDENYPHPGRLLDQPFVHARQMMTHEVAYGCM